MTDEQLRQELLQRLKEDKHGHTRGVLQQLTDFGWLGDGLLRGVDFSEVDLWNIFLVDADLQYANFQSADLTEADLRGADLQHANLSNAELTDVVLDRGVLSHADLRGANLEGASLFLCVGLDDVLFDTDTTLPDGKTWSMGRPMRDFSHPETRLAAYKQELLTGLAKAKGAHFVGNTIDTLRTFGWLDSLNGFDFREAFFTDVNLSGADLRGANLLRAHLTGANLDGVQFDEKTILPDESHWSPQIDLRRFTDPNDPDFYRPPGYWYGNYKDELS